MKKKINNKLEEKFNKALSLRDQNDLEKSSEILNELIAEYPDFPLAYGHLAEIFWRQGKIEQAGFYFRIVTEMIPQSKLASLGLFHMLWKMEDYQAALNEIKRFTKAGYKCQDYDEILEELKAKNMVDDDLNWLENA